MARNSHQHEPAPPARSGVSRLFAGLIAGPLLEVVLAAAILGWAAPVGLGRPKPWSRDVAKAIAADAAE